MKKVQPLRCVLDDAAIKVRTLKLIEHLDEVDRLTDKKKSVANDFTKRIDTEEAIAIKLRSEIVDGTELRDVECIEVPLKNSTEVVLVRLDTYAIVNRRALTDQDKQGELFGEEDATMATELNRIWILFDVSDLFKEIGKVVTTQALSTLTAEQLQQGKDWATAVKAATAAQTEVPPEPDWMPSLLDVSAKTSMSEAEMQVRVDTIRDLLEAQSIEVTEDQVRAWTKEDQDKVMKWVDSLEAESPLDKPDFLPKAIKKKEEKEEKEEKEKEKEKDDKDKTPDTQKTDGADAAPNPDADVNISFTQDELTRDDSEALPGKLSDSEPILEGDDETQASASNNGQMIGGDPTIDSLLDLISTCGVEVRLEAIETWDDTQKSLARQWAEKAKVAIDQGKAREPAPPFFFD